MPFVEFIPPNKDSNCGSRDHNPPTGMILRPGTHVYKCPVCGQKTTVTVPVKTN